ncbi:MAG: FAD-dependent oxidoreductase [Dehalococcoidales bacterium]|nr:FAD-dependent oxidoreductase [Dehalococcoidales bacterium]
MKTIIEPKREIPVLSEFDVIVVGGGAAGIGAALAAGRNGAKTLLIEQANCLGGLQTQCLNPRFTELDPYIQAGLVREIIDRIKKEDAVYIESGRNPHFRGFTFEPEYYKYMLDNMMAEAGVKLLYRVFAVGAIREGNTLKGIIIESKEGRHAILGKVIIDATGSADIAWKAGASCMTDGFPSGEGKGRHMGFGYGVTFREVDIKKFEEFRQANPSEWVGAIAGKNLIKKAKAEGKLHGNRGAFWFSPYLMPGGIWILGPQYPLPMGHHPWLAQDISDGEIDSRKQAWSAYFLLKNNVPGWENSHIDQLPNMVMLRDSHRMLGEYVLKEEDMLAGKAFDDSIAMSNHAPDVFGPDDQHSFIGNVPPYDIPYRSLISKDIDNLMAAGSAMSTDFMVFGATRYCTPSVCTGQAAGTAAALAVKSGTTPKKINVKQVQDTLRKQGVLLTVKEVPENIMAEYRAITAKPIHASMGPTK